MNTYQQMIDEGVFPITFYNYCSLGMPGGRAESVKDWADAGMTIGRTPGFDAKKDKVSDMTAILDACGEADIRALVVDGRGGFGRLHGSTESKFRKGFAAAVKDFGGHPAVFGFDAGDEPHSHFVPSAYRTTAIHQEMAPHLTPFMNLAPYTPEGTAWMGLRSYRKFLDDYCVQSNPPFLCHDVYYQMQNSPEALDVYFRDLKMYTDASMRNGVPLWISLLSVGHYEYRCPNENDLRWQLSTAVASGCKGIVWFFLYMREPHGNYRVPPIDEHWERTETFEWLSRVNRTFRNMQGSVIGKLTLQKVWHVGKAYGGFPGTIDSELIKSVRAKYPLILSEFKDTEGRDYVSIVDNSFDGAGQAVITWHGDPAIYHVGWGGSEGRARNYIDDDNPANTATMTGPWLAPGQIELYRLEQQPEQKPIEVTTKRTKVTKKKARKRAR